MKPTFCTIFWIYFVNYIYNLYTFLTSPGPSSGGITVFMQHWYFVILYSYLSGVQEHMLLHTRQLAIQNNKIPVSHKYSYSSWQWTQRGPKHLEVINKIDEIYWEYCAPSWFHLQDPKFCLGSCEVNFQYKVWSINIHRLLLDHITKAVGLMFFSF